MDDKEEKQAPPPSEVLKAQRARGVALLGELYHQRRTLASQLAEVDAKLAAVHADVDAIDKVSTVL